MISPMSRLARRNALHATDANPIAIAVRCSCGTSLAGTNEHAFATAAFAHADDTGSHWADHTFVNPFTLNPGTHP